MGPDNGRGIGDRSREEASQKDYKVEFSKAARRDLRDLPDDLLDQLETRHLSVIGNSPREVSRPKHGKLAGVWGYDFGPRGGYRILYEVNDSKSLVTVIAIGTHDQAYRRAERRR
jgi:addiction module RelE/StbE family toxin